MMAKCICLRNTCVDVPCDGGQVTVMMAYSDVIVGTL